MSYRIPIGPYHLALEEPYKIELDCQGEHVIGATLKVGFNFRGIEWLAERKNITKAIALMERVCGICSNVHSMTFCMALEQIGGVEVPPRAQYVRIVMAELERLHSHLLWAGIAAELIGFQTLFMQLFRLRECVMDALESISGNRVNYSMNRIGGVNRDIDHPEAVRKAVSEVRDTVSRTLIPLFTTDQTVAARCRGVGKFSRAEAIAYGAVGPVARASGLDTDMRRDHPYLAYNALEMCIRDRLPASGDCQRPPPRKFANAPRSRGSVEPRIRPALPPQNRSRPADGGMRVRAHLSTTRRLPPVRPHWQRARPWPRHERLLPAPRRAVRRRRPG